MGTHDGEDAYRELERQFTEGMYEAYRFLARTINYRAIWFLDMLTQQGGRAAAIQLVYGKDATYGLERLREAGMLDRSVEAWVIDPRFDRLFTDEDRDRARRRLEQYGFDVDGYLEGLCHDE
jgi:hypothetical protein